jgi:LacI family transcriptional regulator
MLVKTPQGGMVVPVQKSVDNESTVVDASPRTERKLSMALVSASGIYYSTTQRLSGMERYAEENGLKFTSFLVPNHEEALEVLSHVMEYEIDGVVVTPYRDERYLSALKTLVEKKFPVVLQNRLDPLPISSVMSSDGVGAYHVTHYLIEKYQRPVYYICSSSSSEVTPERHEGYKNAMKDAGLGEFIEAYTCVMEILNSDSEYWAEEKTWFAGFTAADKLLSKIKFPASIFCENDFDAQGVYEAAKKHQLVIGKDVMVAGFDDYPLAKLLKPGLTTCRAFPEKLGYEEGRLLHRLIKKEVQPPVHIRLPMQLMVRDSA